MSFFPESFDPRDPVVAVFDMCEIDTPDGPARFLIGADGVFTDVHGNDWYGSQLLSAPSMKTALNGAAPSGSLTLAYFQDPDADNLIARVKELGKSYIDGRSIKFFIQPLRSMSELYAPTLAPLQWNQRVCRDLTFKANAAQDRSITLIFESVGEKRRVARRVKLNTEGHSQLIGEPNPSLEFIPTNNFEEEKIWG